MMPMINNKGSYLSIKGNHLFFSFAFHFPTPTFFVFCFYFYFTPLPFLPLHAPLNLTSSLSLLALFFLIFHCFLFMSFHITITSFPTAFRLCFFLVLPTYLVQKPISFTLRYTTKNLFSSNILLLKKGKWKDKKGMCEYHRITGLNLVIRFFDLDDRVESQFDTSFLSR